MALSASGGGRSSTDWTTWKVFGDPDGSEEAGWLRKLRLDFFRFLAVAATVSLALIVIRYLLLSERVAWPDLANAIFFLFLLLLVSRRPDWLTSVTWLGLAACFANAVVGLNFKSNYVVV